MKIKNRIVAVLCALVVAFACIPCTPYSAQNINIQTFLSACGLPQLPEYNGGYKYVYEEGAGGALYVRAYKSGIDNVRFGISKYGNKAYGVLVGGSSVNDVFMLDLYSDNVEWKKTYVDISNSSGDLGAYGYDIDDYKAYYSDFDLYTNYKTLDAIYYPAGYYFTYDFDIVDLVEIPTEVYSPNVGYLHNVTRKTTYIRGALYNYDENSKTYHWSHALQTSTGVDLSSGDFVIRHYISWATVKGYEKKDIIEMTDKVFMAEYDASIGSFSYLDKDYEDKMYAYGFEGLNFFETIFKGYFVLEHNYFQIVNTSTGEVGGYLHFYPLDSDSSHFGVELEYEGLDKEFEEVPDSPSGNIKPNVGSGETLEDALENADAPKLDDLQGIDVFVDNLEAYSQEIKNVSSGLGAFLGEFPPWLLVLLGVSVAFPFVVVVIKSLR